LDIKMDYSTAYHPETDGQTERTNQTLEQYLRIYGTYNQDDWAEKLPMAEFAYNNAENASTGISPFFANKGYHPRSDFALHMVPKPDQDAADFAVDLSELHTILKERIANAQQKAEIQYNKNHLPAPEFELGDRVWLKAENIKTLKDSKKLDDRYLGPFEVITKVSSHAYRLRLPKRLGIHNVFHVRLLEPVTTNTIPNRVAPPPPPLDIQGQQEYEVEMILDCKLDKRRKDPYLYLIRWIGYGPEDDSWEPLQALLKSCGHLLVEYHQKNPRKPPAPPELDDLPSDEGESSDDEDPSTQQ
jgi:hypothetical protein